MTKQTNNLLSIHGKEKIERVVLKIPKSLADYFRKVFPHGKRSAFLAGCILDHKRQEEVKKIEDEFKEINKHRQ